MQLIATNGDESASEYFLDCLELCSPLVLLVEIWHDPPIEEGLRFKRYWREYILYRNICTRS